MSENTIESVTALRRSVCSVLKKALAVLMCMTLLFALAGCKELKRFEALDLSESSDAYSIRIQGNRSCGSFSVLSTNGSFVQGYNKANEKQAGTTINGVGNYDGYIGNMYITLDRDTEYNLYSYFWGYLPYSIRDFFGTSTFTNNYICLIIPPLAELNEKYARMDASQLKCKLHFDFDKEGKDKYSLTIELRIKEKGERRERYALDWESFDPTTLLTVGEIETTGGNETTTASAIDNTTEGNYIVKFNANGGTGMMPAVTCKLNAFFQIPTNRFAREGYKFIGWHCFLETDNEWLFNDGSGKGSKFYEVKYKPDDWVYHVYTDSTYFDDGMSYWADKTFELFAQWEKI